MAGVVWSKTRLVSMEQLIGQKMFHNNVRLCFSTGFERTERTDIGLQLDESDLSLGLYNGITLASLNAHGSKHKNVQTLICILFMPLECFFSVVRLCM